MADTTLPPSTLRGADIDRNALFRELYDRWMTAKKGRNGTALCAFLETRKQILSGYRTGHDGRTPPWWALVRMMHDLGLELRVTSDGCVLTGRRGKSDSGPATRSADVVLQYLAAPI